MPQHSRPTFDRLTVPRDRTDLVLAMAELTSPSFLSLEWLLDKVESKTDPKEWSGLWW